MDNKKEQERDELHKTIWNIADNLRGQVDGWEFKSYVLVTMFYRYISESLVKHINAIGKRGLPDFDYAALDDSDPVVRQNIEEIKKMCLPEKGYFMYPSQLFMNVRKNAHSNENLNETIEKVFREIEASTIGQQSEKDFKGLFEDFNTRNSKLGSTVVERNKKFIQLLDAIGDMNLGNIEDNTIDAFGDAYEYLMNLYASNAGKSGGEFFTPQEVSELLIKLAIGKKTQVESIYDMCCGSGSLLLKAAKILGPENLKNGYYGQEINPTTYNLCRINMFLHGVPYDKFSILRGNTLTNPMHDAFKPFDVIVSNPPYSIKWEGSDNAALKDDSRYTPAGVLAPKSKADLAFIMHALSYLAANGTAAIVCFPGIMYRGGAEAKIREFLVEQNVVDAVIQLPSNLFYGTSIATSILVLKKNKTNDTNIQFIDASNEFIKITKNNKLTAKNIEKIAATYLNREQTPYFSKLATIEEVRETGYNLSVSTYVEKEDTREKIDIQALNSEIDEIVKRQEILRKEIDKIIKEIEG